MLLSIFIIDHSPTNLSALLEYIFSQEKITDFEVIISETPDRSSALEIANQYSNSHPGKITLLHSHLSIDRNASKNKILAMAKGQYYITLSLNQEFNPDETLKTISLLESDPLYSHQLIGRVNERNFSRNFSVQAKALESQGQPLVSICIYNYNYGRYLVECLESVAAQTYKNIEISFSDNASTDESWQIAMEFSKRYSGKMSLVRNRANFGAGDNLANCRRNAHGKYLLMLCSDDAIHPEFIEQCVIFLENNPEAAFALVHREIIDEAGNTLSEPSFYNQTCLIQGEEQAAVYMMAAVNPSVSQVLYNHEKLMTYAQPHGLTVRWFGQRLLDFFLCLESPIIYIKTPLLRNRVHGQSDGAAIDASLVQGIGQYMLALQFAEMSSQHGLKKPATRLGNAIEKIGRLCLRYCTSFLLRHDEVTALRYFHLAQALFPGIESDHDCKALQKYWGASTGERQYILESLQNQTTNISRKTSYDPPPGSIPLY
jgi:glycosyltransferase involved in cell wall biosynthesis